MGKYIYQSHMGGIYACDYQQDYDSLYCEQCGDSDTCLGYAEDALSAFELLKPETDLFDCSLCEKCEHEEDYDYCDEHCEQYAMSGGYSLSYIMEFLQSEFDDAEWDKVYLLLQPKVDEKEYYLVSCSTGSEFGKEHGLPYGYCLPNEKHNIVANNLTSLVYDNCTNIRFIKTIDIDGCKHHIYHCYVDITNNENWEISAHNCDGVWYGYFATDKLNLTKNDKIILDALKE